MTEQKADRRYAAPHQRRRSARSAWQSIALLIGVLLLLWGADSVARLGAETLLERNIQNATGTADRPTVTVHGAFFLPQVLAGAYREVDVTTFGITSGPLRVKRLDSRLFDVRVPFHDVLVQNVRQIGVGRSLENATLTYADLNAYFAATGRRLRLAPAAHDHAVMITGTVDVLDQSVHASAEIDLSVDNGTVRVTPQQIDTGSALLDRASRLLLRQRLSLTVPLGTLPFGHRLTGVTPYSEGLRVSAEGRAVVLDP